jgi:uncharacterized protein (TIGR02145 family)
VEGGVPIAPIEYAVANVAGVTVDGLPSGTTYTYNTSGTPATLTISGAPTDLCLSTYTITLLSSCTDVRPIGLEQRQGTILALCPVPVYPDAGTFESFQPASVAESHYSLTDERDGQRYNVVKMPDNRWWMAQHLNYQGTTQGASTFDLVWNRNSNQANGVSFTSTANGKPAIGSFWCPAGTTPVNPADLATVTVSSADRAGCRLYGALYTFETAMMVDGKWSDETHSNSNFAEPTGQYGLSTTSGNTNNNARGVTKRGICPPNWHVPTDAEWGNMFNLVGLKGTNFNNGANVWLGYQDDLDEASPRLKAACTCPSDNAYCMNDTIVAWYFDSAETHKGTDVYGFRVIAAGWRVPDGGTFNVRGYNSIYWSASANTATQAWTRCFTAIHQRIARYRDPRSYGAAVRCIRD